MGWISQGRTGTEDAEATCRIEGVSKHFGGVRALNDVSLRVSPGQVHGLMGPNGAGKSTLVNVVTGIYPPDSGEVWLGDIRLDGLPSRKIAALGVARTFQNVRLFNTMTVRENVLTGLHQLARERRAGEGRPSRPLGDGGRHVVGEEATRAILSRFGLSERADHVVADLPYAEQKAVDLCRAIVRQPALVLLDEPAAGMGREDRARLLEMIGELKALGNIGVLLIEHDVSLVLSVCDEVSVLNFGALIARGSPDEIRANHEVRVAYLGEAGTS